MQSKSWKIVLVTGLMVVVMATAAQAYPPYATGTGNSCGACHFNHQDTPPGQLPGLAVTSGLPDLDLDAAPRNDGKLRGPLKHFTVEAGNTVTLTMNVLPADPGERPHFAVQLKRLEKDAVLGPLGDKLVYTPDGSWFEQPPGGASAYYTSVNVLPPDQCTEFVGPLMPYSFDLFVDASTPLNTYDLEYAVAGRGQWYSDEHFYLTVTPEPSTLAMLVGLGALGLFVRRRRWRTA